MSFRLTKFLISFVLSLVFLGSTNSYAFYTHHCEGEQVEASWMMQGQGCGMEMHVKSESSSGFSKQPCCENNVDIVHSNIQNFAGSLVIDLGLFPPYMISYSRLDLEDVVLFNIEAFSPIESPPILYSQYNSQAYLQLYLI